MGKQPVRGVNAMARVRECWRGLELLAVDQDRLFTKLPMSGPAERLQCFRQQTERRADARGGSSLKGQLFSDLVGGGIATFGYVAFTSVSLEMMRG